MCIRDSYNITPSKTGYVFTPSSISGSVSSSSIANLDFLASCAEGYEFNSGECVEERFELSGIVRFGSLGLSGVSIRESRLGIINTNSEGFFNYGEIEDLNNYTITPSRTGYVFSPSSLSGNSSNTSLSFSANCAEAVSYTHLTLPTICSV